MLYTLCITSFSPVGGGDWCSDHLLDQETEAYRRQSKSVMQASYRIYVLNHCYNSSSLSHAVGNSY